jgi:hypothetical protein
MPYNGAKVHQIWKIYSREPKDPAVYPRTAL